MYEGSDDGSLDGSLVGSAVGVDVGENVCNRMKVGDEKTTVCSELSGERIAACSRNTSEKFPDVADEFRAIDSVVKSSSRSAYVARTFKRTRYVNIISNTGDIGSCIEAVFFAPCFTTVILLIVI